MRLQLKEVIDVVQLNDLLARWREQPGEPTTQALACLIPELSETFQVKVRDTLADRLQRKNDDELRKSLGIADPELRRAAVLVCGRKKLRR